MRKERGSAPNCFVTVGTAKLEAELEPKERNHICIPWDLKRFLMRETRIRCS